MELSLQTLFMQLESYEVSLWGVSTLGFSGFLYIGQDPCDIENCSNGTALIVVKDMEFYPWGSVVESLFYNMLAVEPWCAV